MAWPKGKPRPPNSGRKKGVPNKVTTDFKEAVTKLLNGANLSKMLKAVPAERQLEVLARIGEYAFPKAKQSVELSGAVTVDFGVDLGRAKE